MEEPGSSPPSRAAALWNAVRPFAPATWAGLAALGLFFICLNIDTCAVRWWFMLPLAAAGGMLLWRRRRSAGRLEARICTAALVLLLALVVLRDIGLSRKLAGLFDQLDHCKSQVDEAYRALGRFFDGRR